MALIKCEECGREISDKAVSCPHCGCPVEKGTEERKEPVLPAGDNNPKSKKTRWGLPIIIIGGLCIVGLVVWGILRKEEFSNLNIFSEKEVRITPEFAEVFNQQNYDFVSSFSDGLALVGKERKYGYINTKGELVIPLEYDDWVGASFSDGLAVVKKNGKDVYINTKGKLAFPTQYDWVSPFSDGIAEVKQDDQTYFINNKGERVFTCDYDRVGYFYEGLAKVEKDDKCGYINKQGKLVIPLEYDNQYSNNDYFSEGLAAIKKDDKYGYINSHGDVVIPLDFEDANPFKEGFALVQKDGKKYLINVKGELLFPCEYRYFGSFHDGLAVVLKMDNTWEGKYGYIDTKGNVVIPFEYEEASNFSEGLATVEKDGKYGIINLKGETVVPFEYDFIGIFSEGLVPASRMGKMGFIDKFGNSTFTESIIAEVKVMEEEQQRIREEEQRQLEEQRRQGTDFDIIISADVSYDGYYNAYCNLGSNALYEALGGIGTDYYKVPEGKILKFKRYINNSTTNVWDPQVFVSHKNGGQQSSYKVNECGEFTVYGGEKIKVFIHSSHSARKGDRVDVTFHFKELDADLE